MKRTILATALVAGALAGAAGAAVNAQEPEPAPSTPVVTPTATPVAVDSPRERGRLPDGRYSSSMTQYRKHGERIAVRIADPAGGPDWAVALFDAERLSLQKPQRTHKGARVIGRNRCVQLGRMQGDEFGWVYGDGRFRPVEIEDQLLLCTSRKRPKPVGNMASSMTIVDPAAPKLAATVLWGLIPGANEATVSGTGAADGPAETSEGAFLRLTGPDGRPSPAAQISGNGKRIRLGPSGLPARFLRNLRFPTLSGPQAVEAPAPDPSGGPRWGLAVAPTREGVPCVGGPTRVVEGRSGGVDLRLALFTEGLLTGQSCRPLQTRPDAKRPCDIGTGFGNAEELEGEDAFLQRARAERRLLAGRTTIYGQCSADVERVTLETPRDVRTMLPSAVGHAVLAVYDGDFVGGGGTFTAHLRGGRTWKQQLMLGGP